VDDVTDEAADRPHHPAAPPFYLPPRDIIINSRPDDAAARYDRHLPGGERHLPGGGGAAADAGFPSLLSNYQFYVGTPDLKPSHHHRRDPQQPQDS